MSINYSNAPDAPAIANIDKPKTDKTILTIAIIIPTIEIIKPIIANVFLKPAFLDFFIPTIPRISPTIANIGKAKATIQLITGIQVQQ